MKTKKKDKAATRGKERSTVEAAAVVTQRRPAWCRWLAAAANRARAVIQVLRGGGSGRVDSCGGEAGRGARKNTTGGEADGF